MPEYVENPNQDYHCEECGNFEALRLRNMDDRLLCEDCEYQLQEEDSDE